MGNKISLAGLFIVFHSDIDGLPDAACTELILDTDDNILSLAAPVDGVGDLKGKRRIVIGIFLIDPFAGKFAVDIEPCRFIHGTEDQIDFFAFPCRIDIDILGIPADAVVVFHGFLESGIFVILLFPHGIGTDRDALTPGEGLESAANAYLVWIDAMRKRFPNVLFETCSSGGMRMDYATLSHFSIVSTSDQTNYRKYPYIAGNILAAVLPEQAAVWSYPVDTGFGDPNSTFQATKEWVEAHISKEQVIMNMINSFLGRMHLASHIELLSAEKQSLVQEGVSYYNQIRTAKKEGLPYFPCGFTRFGADFVASGFTAKNTLYLAVWNLGGAHTQTITLDGLDGLLPTQAKVAYPLNNEFSFSLQGNVLSLQFTEDYQARMFEIQLEKPL